MSLRIDQDHTRFRSIVRGKIRDNLKQYITQGELIGKQGKGLVSIPVPRIDVPRFTFGERDAGGVGQGPGSPGDALGGAPGEEGQGRAGQEAGEHRLEVEVTLDELADLLGEELELPAIESKGKRRLATARDKYTGLRRVGPESLKHFKRTYKEALRRAIASGSYDPRLPLVVPQREDKRFRAWSSAEEPAASAVIVYMMDVSGSMGDEQKELVRIESFWIDTWLRRQYKGLESRYIIHDAQAREVDRETFFSTREAGGTMISSAYQLCARLLQDHYPSEEWNTYLFHFSDGDNWSMEDTLSCVTLLRGALLPRINQFGYGQVESPYGSGQFLRDLREHLGQEPRLVTSEIPDREGIVQSIRDFLGRGR